MSSQLVVEQSIRGLEWEVVLPIGGDGRGPWQVASSEYNAVMQNLRVILGVEPGEWTRRPWVGTGLSSIVDEPATEDTLSIARAVIRAQITLYERRLDLTRLLASYPPIDLDDVVKLKVEIYGIIVATGERLAVAITLTFEV